MNEETKKWLDEIKQYRSIGRLLDGKEPEKEEPQSSPIPQNGIFILAALLVLVICFGILIAVQSTEEDKPEIAVATLAQKVGIERGSIKDGKVLVGITQLGSGVIPPGTVKMEGNIFSNTVTYIDASGKRTTATLTNK